jgi:hypothetical protein
VSYLSPEANIIIDNSLPLSTSDFSWITWAGPLYEYLTSLRKAALVESYPNELYEDNDADPTIHRFSAVSSFILYLVSRISIEEISLILIIRTE